MEVGQLVEHYVYGIGEIVEGFKVFSEYVEVRFESGNITVNKNTLKLWK